MKGIVLTMNEHNKYLIIKNLVDKNGNKKRVALKLGVTIRSINRYINNYKKYGKAAFRHKNHDYKPKSTLPDYLKNDIIALYKEKYFDFNFSHFREKLQENENIIISYSALYNLLSSNDIISKKANRSTKRNHQKKNKITNTEVIDDVLITNNEVDLSSSHPRKERAKYFGEIIQMDASHHLWFGNKKSHLHLAIDDCLGEVVGAYFDWQETLDGYNNVFHQILTKYGIPYMYLTDNRTIFNYKSLKTKSLEKDTHTQFSFACSLLGTEIKTTSIPQSKGKVERSFNTFQDRLISELRLNDITTIEEANLFLKSYVSKHNKKFALPKKNITSVFEKQPSNEEINLILATRYERVIDKGNCIKFKHQYYQTFENGKLITLKPKRKCMIIKAYDEQLFLESGDKIYELKKLSTHQETSRYIDLDVINKEVKSKAHTPALNHPWRNEIIKSHQRKLIDKIKTLEEYYDDCTPLETV